MTGGIIGGAFISGPPGAIGGIYLGGPPGGI
jgi:hypothetical protein